MEQEKIINDFTNLPPAAQRQVVDFIAFLRTRYKPPSTQKPRVADWSKESFVGIWKKREDMNDSVSWVRQTRRTQWQD
ncbi:MAG: DUF2281 domain-containing protein [Desulfobacteraceae bacterium]|nr:DUF2281 domain-containing protein [Desulfobacteraceae bacterium]